jgi:hypothetical protein
MRRRVGADDLKRVSKLMRRQDVTGEWAVCDGYEVRNGEIFARRLAQDVAKNRRWKVYRPLEDHPDLFLKLAEMHEASNFTGAALAFSREYGVLGGSSGQSPGADYEISISRTSLSSWREEAERAWVILKLYEASLSFDGETVVRLHLEHGDGALRGSSFDPLRNGGSSDVDLAGAQVGFVNAALMVERTKNLLCREVYRFGPDVDDDSDIEDLSPSRFQARIVWTFDNLLGAMYLQMFRFIGSDGALGRCEYCGRTFFLARTDPDVRKPRRDKRFCDDACRQAHHRSKKARG